MTSVSFCFWPLQAATPALARSRPYQGVRVRDPVKELLRRKRTLELHSAKAAPATPVRTLWHNDTDVNTQTGPSRGVKESKKYKNQY